MVNDTGSGESEALGITGSSKLGEFLGRPVRYQCYCGMQGWCLGLGAVFNGDDAQACRMETTPRNADYASGATRTSEETNKTETIPRRGLATGRVKSEHCAVERHATATGVCCPSILDSAPAAALGLSATVGPSVALSSLNRAETNPHNFLLETKPRSCSRQHQR